MSVTRDIAGAAMPYVILAAVVAGVWFFRDQIGAFLTGAVVQPIEQAAGAAVQGGQNWWSQQGEIVTEIATGQIKPFAWLYPADTAVQIAPLYPGQVPFSYVSPSVPIDLSTATLQPLGAPGSGVPYAPATIASFYEVFG